MKTLSLFQLYVENLLDNQGWYFLKKRYDKVLSYTSEANKVQIILSGGYYLTGLHITITPKGLDIYKTDKEDKLDTLRHLFGYNNNVTTVTSGKTVADSEREYAEINHHIVEPIYFDILSKIPYENLIELIDDQLVHRKIGTRKSLYLSLQNNRKQLFQYLTQLARQYRDKQGEYLIREVHFPYISLSNYNRNISSELLIQNPKGERIIIVGYNRQELGMQYLIGENLEDNFLYELVNVLKEVKVESNFLPVHKDIILKRLNNYLSYYVEKKPTPKQKGSLKNNETKNNRGVRGSSRSSRRVFKRAKRS